MSVDHTNAEQSKATSDRSGLHLSNSMMDNSGAEAASDIDRIGDEDQQPTSKSSPPVIVKQRVPEKEVGKDSLLSSAKPEHAGILHSSSKEYHDPRPSGNGVGFTLTSHVEFPPNEDEGRDDEFLSMVRDVNVTLQHQ